MSGGMEAIVTGDLALVRGRLQGYADALELGAANGWHPDPVEFAHDLRADAEALVGIGADLLRASHREKDNPSEGGRQ